jgi:hypothetical protein
VAAHACVRGRRVPALRPRGGGVGGGPRRDGARVRRRRPRGGAHRRRRALLRPGRRVHGRRVPRAAPRGGADLHGVDGLVAQRGRHPVVCRRGATARARRGAGGGAHGGGPQPHAARPGARPP